MRKAEEFAAIFDDEDAVLLEAEQAMNPNSYLPQQNDIHRAPKDKKVGKGRVKKVEEKNGDIDKKRHTQEKWWERKRKGSKHIR